MFLLEERPFSSLFNHPDPDDTNTKGEDDDTTTTD